MLRIRESMSYFRIAVVITLVVALLSTLAGATVGLQSFLGLPNHPPTLSNSNSRSFANSSAGVTELSAIAGLFAIGALVLELVAYLKWRDGLKALQRGAWEYGPAHLESVGAAQRDRRAAFGSFMIQMLLGIILVLVVVADVFQVVSASAPGGVAFTPSQLADLQRQLTETILVGAILSAILSTALYFFASRSLARVLATTRPASPDAAVLVGRWLMVAGGAASVLGILVLYEQYGGLAAALGPLLVALGLSELIAAYDRWLAGPPPPSPDVARGMMGF